MISKLTLKKHRITTIKDFLALDYNQRNDIYIEKGFSKTQIQDIENVLKEFPQDIEVKVNVCIDEGEKKFEITPNSIVTAFIEVSRPSKKINSKNKEEPIEVHAPYFPFQKNEFWWLIIADEKKNRIVTLKKVTSLRDNLEIKIPFPAPKKYGNYFYTLFLMCDSYIGFDIKTNIKLNVIKETIEEKDEFFEDDESENESENENEKNSGDENKNEDEKSSSGDEKKKENEKDNIDENKNDEEKNNKEINKKKNRKLQKKNKRDE